MEIAASVFWNIHIKLITCLYLCVATVLDCLSGLLGHGKKEEWDMKLPEFDSSSYSSDTESVEDVWSINDEQREYYVKQFHTVEHDSNGHISGTVSMLG